VRSVLISTDPDVRGALRRALDDRGVELAMEIAVPFGDMTDEQIADLRRCDPDVACLDFDEDPATAVSFARFLTENSAHRIVIGTGPALDAAVLLDAMRAGVAEYLPKPIEDVALNAALDRAARRLGWAPATREPGQLLAVFSPKGGAGTTTVATNLAIVLHRLTGKRTLLVDLDLELGEVAVLLGLRPRFSFVDLAQSFSRIDAGLLASFIEHHDSGVHLLSAPFHPDLATRLDSEQIRSILGFLKRQYDYVVVDTPKSFAVESIAAFEEADRVFLVTTAGVPALRNLQRCKPVLERVFGKGDERLRLVVNRYDSSDVISLEDVKRTVGLDVYWTLSNDYEAVSHSINSATPVAQNARSRYARDLQALGVDVLGLRPRANGGRRLSGSRILGDLIGRFRGRSEEPAS
jgi:pilus assembly protein CpaE